jgi:hypothetical protein
MTQMGSVACMGEMTNTYEILTRKHEGKKSHRRLTYTMEYNIKTRSLKKSMVKCGLDASGSGEGWWQILLNMVMHRLVP